MEYGKHREVLLFFIILYYSVCCYGKAVFEDPDKYIKGYEYSFKNDKHNVRPLYETVNSLKSPKKGNVYHDTYNVHNGKPIFVPPTQNADFIEMLNDYYNSKENLNHPYKDLPVEFSTNYKNLLPGWPTVSSDIYNAEGYERPVITSSIKKNVRDKTNEAESDCRNCHVETLNSDKMYSHKLIPSIEYAKVPQYISKPELFSSKGKIVEKEKHVGDLHVSTTTDNLAKTTDNYYYNHAVEVIERNKHSEKNSNLLGDSDEYYKPTSQQNSKNVKTVGKRHKKTKVKDSSLNYDYEKVFSPVISDRVKHKSQSKIETERDYTKLMTDKEKNMKSVHPETAENPNYNAKDVLTSEKYTKVSATLDKPIKTKCTKIHPKTGVPIKSCLENENKHESLEVPEIYKSPVTVEISRLPIKSSIKYNDDNVKDYEEDESLSNEHLRNSAFIESNMELNDPLTNKLPEKKLEKCTKIHPKTGVPVKGCLENKISHTTTKVPENFEHPVIVKTEKGSTKSSVKYYEDEAKGSVDESSYPEKPYKDYSEFIESSVELHDPLKNKLPKKKLQKEKCTKIHPKTGTHLKTCLEDENLPVPTKVPVINEYPAITKKRSKHDIYESNRGKVSSGIGSASDHLEPVSGIEKDTNLHDPLTSKLPEKVQQKETKKCTKMQPKTGAHLIDCSENENTAKPTKYAEIEENPVIVDVKKHSTKSTVIYGEDEANIDKGKSPYIPRISDEYSMVIGSDTNALGLETFPGKDIGNKLGIEDESTELNIPRNFEDESEIQNLGSGLAVDDIPENLEIDDRLRRLSLLNSNLFSLVFNPNAKDHNLKKCVTRSNETGFCMYVQNCPIPNIATSLEQLLNNACVVDDVFIGVCCPEFPVETIEVQWERSEKDSSNKDEEFDHEIEDCGTRSKEASKMQSWPWKAPLVSMSNGRIFCGGVIIGEEYVLTAAHCTTKIPRNQILVRLGQHDESSGEDFVVVEIKRHAQYNPRTLQNDVALLKLGRHVQFGRHINKVCLPEDDGESHDGEKALLLGWKGVFGENPKKSEFLEVISNEECRKQMNTNVAETLLCTETRDEDETTCNADSGAPLVIEDDDEYEVIGILSWNRNDCDPRFPSTFSRISSYLGWIQKHAV